MRCRFSSNSARSDPRHGQNAAAGFPEARAHRRTGLVLVSGGRHLIVPSLASLHQTALVPTFAAREYDRLQYGSLSLRANQRLQTRRAEHRHRRRAIRIFDRRRSKDATSIHNPNDSGAPFKRGPLPSFADQVRRETGQRAAGLGGGSSSRVA